jgi:hypothetical protein
MLCDDVHIWVVAIGRNACISAIIAVCGAIPSSVWVQLQEAVAVLSIRVPTEGHCPPAASVGYPDRIVLSPAIMDSSTLEILNFEVFVPRSPRIRIEIE